MKRYIIYVLLCMLFVALVSGLVRCACEKKREEKIKLLDSVNGTLSTGIEPAGQVKSLLQTNCENEVAI